MDSSNHVVVAANSLDVSAGHSVSQENKKKAKTKKYKAKRAPLILMIVGLIVLVAGLVVLFINILAKPGLRDAEYLVKIGNWQREDEPSVIWNFSSIGEGKLTTNNHKNDYDFKWALEDDKMKIETDWLYVFDEEYSYELDQAGNKLTISTDDENWYFVPATGDKQKEIEDASVENMVEQ